MAGAGWMLESVILEQQVCPVHLSFLGRFFCLCLPVEWEAKTEILTVAGRAL